MTATATTMTVTRAPAGSWDRLLIAATGVVIAADVVFLALVGEVIPPIAAVTVVTIAGLALYRWKRRAGIVLLGTVALLWGVGSLGFSLPHLAHPESGIDFVHAATEIGGRLVIAVAAVGAWRGGGSTRSRRLAVTAASLLVLTFAVGLIATVTSSGATAQDGDVVATVEHASFPDVTVVDRGGALLVRNADLFRHTFTVEGTDVSVELPTKQATRVPIDLAAGTYTVVCQVPGHEFMEGTIEVR